MYTLMAVSASLARRNHIHMTLALFTGVRHIAFGVPQRGDLMQS